MCTGRWYRLLLIVPATIMNVVLFIGVYRLIPFAAPAVDGVNVLQQAVLNVAAGFVVIGVSEQVPALWSRLRGRRVVLAIQRWRTN